MRASSWRLLAALCCSLLQWTALRSRLADAACGDIFVQSRSVNESAAVGFVILPVDSSYSDRFSVIQSLYSCYLNVTGGALVLAKPLDLENFTFCSNGSTTPLASVPAALAVRLMCVSSSTETVVVNLFDIDEFAPAFKPGTFSANVSESGANGKFSMPDSATSGTIRVSGALDYDAGQRLYVMNVSAAELASNPGSMPFPLTGFATVEVSIRDADDQNPAFLDSGYTLSFMENDSSLLGRDLVTQPPLEARDLDLGINQTINYAIDAGNVLNNVTYLEINATTGRLKLTAVLDRETLAENPMWLRVRAYQTDKPSLRTAMAFVSVTVTDRNDNKPVMSSSNYSASIAENSPNGSFVAQVWASDADFGSNATVIYKLTDPTGAFLIEPSTGVVRVANSNLLDRETTSQFVLAIWAEESLTVERYASTASLLTVVLTDVNDNAPVFSQSEYAFAVSAGATVGSTVGVVSATDTDVGQNAIVVYSLTFASPTGSSAYFRLDAGNGSLTIAAPLASLASPVFLLAVAEDQAVPTSLRLRSTVPLTVTLTAETTTPAGSSTTATTATAATAATVWNTSTLVLTAQQLNATHLILEVQTTVFDSSGRSFRFNQSTLSQFTSSTTSTDITASTMPTSSSAASSMMSQPPVSMTSSSGGSASTSSSGSTLETALIALCALMALLLAAALVAILCFWKRRPGGSAAVSPGDVASAGGGAGSGSSGGHRAGGGGGRYEGGSKDGGVSSRAHKGKLAASSNSSRINYAEFYFDDRDVSGTPIMVLQLQQQQLHGFGEDPGGPRPPSYSQLPRVAK